MVGREGEQTGERANCVFGCWRTVHAALVELARKRAGLDLEEVRLLLAARRAEVHRSLGYGSFSEYVERLFGYAPRLTHEKLRVAAALEALPALARELREGTISFSHARELTRVARSRRSRPGSKARAVAPRDRSKSSFLAAVWGRFPILQKKPRSSVTCCASKSRAKRWQPFAKLSPSFGAKQESTSTTTRRFSS